jgi:3-oxoacyl-[acyl-carrier-protein] synthase-1
VTDVFLTSDNIITSLGFSTGENAANMLADQTGIRNHEDVKMSPEPFYASLVESSLLHDHFSTIGDPDQYTRFEQLAICSMQDALSNSGVDPADPGTLFILSTTKGNIDLLEKDKKQQYGKERIYLWNTAKLLQNFFKFRNDPVVISNACISGVQAVLTGSRLIRAGLYENVVINGTDIISAFVLSGFTSFKSLSTGPCRPFDKSRDGLSMGEGSGTVILTKTPYITSDSKQIVAEEGFITNDANHISGPSRTGEGLFIAINTLLKRNPVILDYISAHGTATPYNDEMESIALTRSGLHPVPVNSYKGYWGHTLGAAGIIETIMCLYSIRNNVLFNTKGYHEMGVSHPLNIIDKAAYREINNCLKIASGFGGCNAALLLQKK